MNVQDQTRVIDEEEHEDAIVRLAGQAADCIPLLGFHKNAEDARKVIRSSGSLPMLVNNITAFIDDIAPDYAGVVGADTGSLSRADVSRASDYVAVMMNLTAVLDEIIDLRRSIFLDDDRDH